MKTRKQNIPAGVFRKLRASAATLLLLLLLSAPDARASYTYTCTITAAEIVATVQATGDPLSTPNAVYGISDVIIRPYGIDFYSLANPFTSLSTWNADSRIPGFAWVYDPLHYPAYGYVEFYYRSGTGLSPVYLVTDQSDMSRFPGLYEHDMLMPPAKAPDDAIFTFLVTTDSHWCGSVMFELQGTRYGADGSVYPFSQPGSALFDLEHNQNGGYIDSKCVPIPGTLLLFGSGLAGLFGIRRKIASKRSFL